MEVLHDSVIDFLNETMKKDSKQNACDNVIKLRESKLANKKVDSLKIN